MNKYPGRVQQNLLALVNGRVRVCCRGSNVVWEVLPKEVNRLSISVETLVESK